MTASRPRRVRVTARAKLNLGLAVGPLRPDGFHELATIFQSVSLADTLVAEPARHFSLRVRHESAATRGALPAGTRRLVTAGPDNLVLRAARLWTRTHRGSPARFTLIKRIPSRAGMGGGSADAAAALAAMDALHGVRTAPLARLEMAARLGSDVPFATMGGTALGLGRGEHLSRIQLDRTMRALIAVPKWHVDTRAAFLSLDRHKNFLTAWKRQLGFAQSIARKRLSALRATRLGNTFEHVLGRHRAAFVDLRSRLIDAGLADAHLTGSGSAVFGLVEPGVPARRILERFAGSEALYVVRSARRAIVIERIPASSG